MPAKKIKDNCSVIERYLEVEFLHSLGCYANASKKANEIASSSISDAGGALRCTHELNLLLDEARDHPLKPSRHPNPCKVERRGGSRKDHERGLLLEKGSRDRLQLITDFYSTGIAALNCLLEPSDSEPEGDRKALEELGACLFWDRDPSSSAYKVNEAFATWQKDLGRLRAGEMKKTDFLTKTKISRRMEAKRHRFVARRQRVEEALRPRQRNQHEWQIKHAAETAAKFTRVNLANAEEGVVSPGFVLQCLVAAHLRLHHVEYFLSRPFKQAMGMDVTEREDALKSLREAEALNTFVYAICRSFPWIFAADDEEAGSVIKQCKIGFGAGESDGNTQLREAGEDVFEALWRSQRMAFMALHRRAFGHSLRDKLLEESYNDTAFKDYHKLQRLLRVQRRIHLPVEERLGKQAKEGVGSLSPISPLVFLHGIDALAETHIGDLYRSDHAHPVALEHFCDAHDRLEQLSENLVKRTAEMETGQGLESRLPAFEQKREGPEAVAEQLRDSRWRIHLMMSKGKGFYEAGNLKRSVKWLLKSWGALLVLIDHTEGGLDRGDHEKTKEKLEREDVFEELSNAVELLREVKNDPDFSKEELADVVESVIDRIEETYVPPKVKVIASEILLRLGHVLYVIRLGVSGSPSEHDLAKRCLERAKFFDRYSTLVTADRLKIEYELGEFKGEKRKALTNKDLQWPFGRGNPDQIIRMIEYHLLWWLASQEDKEIVAETPRDTEVFRQNRDVARRLISGLLTHTDSINVRQSQVYRYLMQPKSPPCSVGPAEGWNAPPPASGDKSEVEPAIEFVCLRRYSSFFPFVPRPSAFRSLGGGYLLRLHHRDARCPQPFGIAIDPGPDFIENLYRCGFGLGDINMIILTHDHPDHSVELHPILALLGYRMKQGDDTFVAPQRKEGKGDDDDEVRRLLIVGNESVARQLRFFNKPHVSQPDAGNPKRQRPDAVQVVSFDEFESLRKEMEQVRGAFQQPEVAIPRELQLKPVISIRHPDGYGMLAYGFRLSLGDHGPSIGFTGDTGGFILEQEDENDPDSPWRIEPNDANGTMKLIGDSSWREHWADVLEADVLIPHISGLPLSQLLVLANEGKSKFEKTDEKLREILADVWNGLDEQERKQVSFAFWLQEDDQGIATLPLEEISGAGKWPKGHLYLIGLLEFARAYQSVRREAGKRGLFLVGELREELGSLRGKIAFSLNKEVFHSSVFEEGGEETTECRALTADVGLRLMISRQHQGAKVDVLCSICDLDNDRTRRERFHDPAEIREVCVKGENEGMFYNCSNHDPLRYASPVFVERVERYDIFSDSPVR